MPPLAPLAAPVAQALLGAATTLAPFIGPAATVGGALIGANAMKQQSQAQLEGARIAAASRGVSTPGASVIAGPAGPAQQPATPGSGGVAPYAGGGTRYNSAQQLTTAPSLTGTGSGFNAAAASGQPQKEELGQTGVQ